MYEFLKYVFSSRGLLVSEPDLPTVFLYNNASYFLGSVVVWCMQELSNFSKRGLPLWLPRCLGGDALQRQWQQLGGKQGKGCGERSDMREDPECFHHEAPENFSPEHKETSKLTRNLGTCLCGFMDPGSCSRARKETLQCVPAWECGIPFRHVASRLFSSFPMFVGFQAQCLTKCPRTRL